MFLALLLVGLSALMAEFGIRTGFKIRHPLGFAGSIPARRTVHDQLLEVVMFFGVVYFFVLHLFAMWGLFAAADWWVRRD